MIKYYFYLLILFMLPKIVVAQYYQKSPTGGLIDWTGQVIHEIGIGSPNPNLPISAQRAGSVEAAKAVALGNLLEMVRGMHIYSNVSIEQYMVASDVVRDRVLATVTNFKVTDTRYKNNRSVEVEVEVPLSAIFRAVLPEQLKQNISPDEFMSPSEVPLLSTYSGLIVDAQGFQLIPALAPKIFDEQNRLVYGIEKVNNLGALERGIVIYEKDVSKAKTNERIADNPLLVKVLKTVDGGKIDMVISDEDAEKIRNLGKNVTFLQEGRVIIVMD